MGLFSDDGTTPPAKPFRAQVNIDQSEIRAFIVSALNKRGCTSVTIAFRMLSTSDPLGAAALVADITATKGGQSESETIGRDQIASLVRSELQADGHTLEGLEINHTDFDHQTHGKFTLLVPRKR